MQPWSLHTGVLLLQHNRDLVAVAGAHVAQARVGGVHVLAPIGMKAVRLRFVHDELPHLALDARGASGQVVNDALLRRRQVLPAGGLRAA